MRDGVANGGDFFVGGGAMGAGGAIFSQGNLNLEQCTLVANHAVGGTGSASAGDTGGAGVGQTSKGSDGGGPNGGAEGASGNPNGGPGDNGGFGGGGQGGLGGNGGNGGGAGLGGALFNDAGTLTLSNTTLASNTAVGGNNGYGPAGNGSGYGGAIFNYNGSLSLDFVTLANNSVAHGTGGTGGAADGGAIYSLGDSLANCSTGGNTCATSAATLTMNRSIAAGSSGANDVVTNAIHGGGNSSSGTDNLIETQTGCGGSLSGNTYATGAITADCAVTTEFAIDMIALTGTASGGHGTISPPGVNVGYGATHVFTLMPDSGYHVTSVTGCGGTLNSSTYTTAPITAPCTVTATFAQTIAASVPVPMLDDRMLLLLAGLLGGLAAWRMRSARQR